MIINESTDIEVLREKTRDILKTLQEEEDSPAKECVQGMRYYQCNALSELFPFVCEHGNREELQEFLLLFSQPKFLILITLFVFLQIMFIFIVSF